MEGIAVLHTLAVSEITSVNAPQHRELFPRGSTEFLSLSSLCDLPIFLNNE